MALLPTMPPEAVLIRKTKRARIAEPPKWNRSPSGGRGAGDCCLLAAERPGSAAGRAAGAGPLAVAEWRGLSAASAGSAWPSATGSLIQGVPDAKGRRESRPDAVAHLVRGSHTNPLVPRLGP